MVVTSLISYGSCMVDSSDILMGTVIASVIISWAELHVGRQPELKTCTACMYRNGVSECVCVWGGRGYAVTCGIHVGHVKK